MENQVCCDPQSYPSEARPATMYAPDGSVTRVEIRVEHYDATVWSKSGETYLSDDGRGYRFTARERAVTRQRFVIRWNGVEYQPYHTTNECDNRYPCLPLGQAEVLDASQAANRFAWGDGDSDAGFILSARNSKHYVVLADDVRAEGLNQFHAAVAASRAAEQAEAARLAAHLEALAAAATSIRVIEEGGRHSSIVVLLGDVVLDRQPTSGSVWRELLDAQGQPNISALKAWARRAVAGASGYLGEVDKSRIAKILFERPIK